MNTSDFNKQLTAQALNENLYKGYNVRFKFDKYSREDLENYRNILRTKVHQVEQEANFNELLTNEGYQKDKHILDVLNARIKEMLGEAKLAEKAVSKAQQKFMGMVHAAKKGEKPASKAVAKVAKGMSKKDAKDYAATKHKGLPAHKKSDESVEEGTKMKTTKKAKPDFLDMDKDGNKKEPMKKAIKDKKIDEISSDLATRYLDKAQSSRKNDKAHAAMTSKQRDNRMQGSNTAREKVRAGKGLDSMARVATVGEGKKAKPDFLDMDKDGNKKEPMKKAVADKKKAAPKKAVKEARMSAAERAHHHAMEYMKHHKAGNLEMAMHHREACEECGGMIQHGPMGECWHMHSGRNKGTPYKVGLSEIMTAEGRANFKNRTDIIAESVAMFIAEDEEGKAKSITAGVDMVNDFTTWMQRIGNYQTKTMIELADNIRANFGVQEAETFKSSVGPALESALNSLTQAREEINNAVAVLAGEAPAQEPMGPEPEMPEGEPGMEPSEDDSLNLPTVDDEFSASDAAAGGPETAGRMKRESIERGNRLMRILGA